MNILLLVSLLGILLFIFAKKIASIQKATHSEWNQNSISLKSYIYILRIIGIGFVVIGLILANAS